MSQQDVACKVGKRYKGKLWILMTWYDTLNIINVLSKMSFLIYCFNLDFPELRDYFYNTAYNNQYKQFFNRNNECQHTLLGSAMGLLKTCQN